MTRHIEFSALMPCDSDFLYRWHTMPRAINRLTPPWENIAIIEQPKTLAKDQKVHIKLEGLIDWKLKILDLEEGKSFSDTQISGPFSSWTHEHSMQAINSTSSLLVERINFKLPILNFSLGEIFIESKLRPLFNYRFKTMLNDLRMHYMNKDTKPMKILISGSSGLVGSALVDFLSSGGHKVSRLLRNETNQEKLEGYDVIIHLAGENIANKRWTEDQKEKISKSRIDGTNAIAGALLKLNTPPSTFLCASAIGFYGDRGEELCNEDSEAGDGFLAETCSQWEKACERLKGKGIRVINTRFGIILDPRSGALGKMLPVFKLGAGGRLGNGKQWMSWIALDDVLGVILHCIINGSISGPVNVVSPNPVTNNEFTKVLGKVLKRLTIAPAPSIALKLALGEMADALLLSSTKVEAKVLKNTGYEFAYPDLEAALRHMLGK